MERNAVAVTYDAMERTMVGPIEPFTSQPWPQVLHAANEASAEVDLVSTYRDGQELWVVCLPIGGGWDYEYWLVEAA